MDTKKTLIYLEEIESLAHSILQDKHDIIEASKRHNVNREGLRAIQRAPAKKHFLSIGGMLIKTDKSECENIIGQDQAKLDARINILRSEMKVKVNKLRDLEYEPPVAGLMLTPMSRDEMNAVRQVMGGHSQ